MLEHLNNVAASLGLPFGTRKNTYNSRLAQELGLWAESSGKGEQFHLAAFHAYFARGRNLAKRQILLDLAHTAGLDKEQAAEVLEKRTYSAAVDADWQLSRTSGITAVPTFMTGGAKLTGAHNYKDLLRFIRNSTGELEKI